MAILLLLSGAATGQGADSSAPVVSGTTLDISLSNARTTRGVLRICLTRIPRHFPDCSRDTTAQRLTIPASATTAQFTGVAEGLYAVSLLHDENSNGRMDMTLMVPREGFGFSRNPHIGIGSPSFSSSAFNVGPTPARQAVRIRYLL